MKRTTRSLVTAGLGLVIAAGIGAYAVVISQDDDKPVIDEDKALLHVGEIQRVEVSGRRTYHLEKEGAAWRIVKPHQMLADEKLAGALEKWLSDEVKQTFTAEDMPGDAESGLKEPLFLVRVVGAKGTALLTVGRISSFNRQLHVRVEEDQGTRTVLADAALIRALDKDPERFLLRETLGVHPRRLERLRVTPRPSLVVDDKPAIPFLIERTDVVVAIQGVQAERFFVVKEPKVDGPDIETLQRVTGVFANPIIRFNADNPEARAKVGLDDPAYTIEYAVKLEDGSLREAKMSLSDPREGVVYMTRSDMPFIAELNESIYHALATTRPELETKKVLVLDVTAVRALELKLDGVEVRAEKTPGGGGVAPGWKMTKPKEAEANTAAVNKLVVAFSLLSGSDRATDGESLSDAELARFGLGAGQRREVRFFTRDDLPLGEVWIGKAEGGHHYVMRKDGTYVARVPDARLAFLPKTVNELL